MQRYNGLSDSNRLKIDPQMTEWHQFSCLANSRSHLAENLHDDSHMHANAVHGREHLGDVVQDWEHLGDVVQGREHIEKLQIKPRYSKFDDCGIF